jgi:polyisoprenyl-phosphate glycosyltransferase
MLRVFGYAAVASQPVMKQDLITIVLPAHKEEANVRPLYAEIRRALDSSGHPSELIFVDDGSTDGTAQGVRDLASADSQVRLIRFSRNFGQQAALLAGLRAARGSAVITMDCDFQHPPELLPQMVEAWDDGAKIVQMVRRRTEDAGWFKQVSSRWFYRLIERFSDSPVVRHAADYQLLDRQIVNYLLEFGDRQPFLRGLVSWLGFSARQIEYTAPGRRAGRSSYSLRRMLNLSLDAITSLSSKPLRLAFYLGLSAAALGLIYVVFAVGAYLAGRSVQGWTSLVVAIVFLGGVQLVCIGIIGEYIARIYEHTRRMPPFIVAEDDQTATVKSRDASVQSMR